MACHTSGVRGGLITLPAFLRKRALMPSISEAFVRCRNENRLAFIPFLTAGDPDLDATRQAVQTLADAGVDLLEIGVPYSDPIADGPVIQASYTRALKAGFSVPSLLDNLAGIDASVPPRLLMVSYAILHRRGPEAFCEAASKSGVSGLIVPDLPGTDAAELLSVAQDRGLDLVQLVAPTTPPARAARIVQTCTGFVYCVAVAGITGERAAVAEDLDRQLAALREVTDLPLAVGFGISSPEHVEPLRGKADGVIVGSGIVRRLEAGGEAGLAEVGRFAREMVAACRGVGG